MSWGGGDITCEGDPQTGTPDCLASVTLKPQLQRRDKGTEDLGRMGFGVIDKVADRIVVGRRLTHPAVVFIRFTGIVGFMPALGELRRLPDQELPEPSEDEAEECTAEMIGDMGGLLDTPEKQQLIADFLNSADGASLWVDSGYRPSVSVGRLEQAGYLLPDGTFMPAQNAEPTACGVTFDPPDPSWPEGTILVHTHPFSHRDSLDVCGEEPGQFYQNVPSDQDVGTLIGTGLSIGLIIDADGIIVFTQNYESELTTPNEADSKGDEDGKCGFAR